MDMREWQERQKKQSGHTEPENKPKPVQTHQQRTDSRPHGSNQRDDRQHDQRRQGNNHGGRQMGQHQQRGDQQPGGNVMTELFHNPYHFIPTPNLQGSRNGDCLKADFINNAKPHLTHEKYLTDDHHHSGRIVCRLDTISPIFVGGHHPERVKGHVLEIPHFEIEDKVPALPATSIRGVIASLAEAASNSALRVLEEEHYSRRAAMTEALKALGILEKDPKDGKLKLRPLMMPAMKCDDMNGSNARLVDPGIYRTVYKTGAASLPS